MKAKNSLWAMLWPLIKQIIQFKNRFLISRKPPTQSNPFNMDLRKVAADGKRIAEKMQAMQLLAEQSKLQNKSPSTPSTGMDSTSIDPENGRLLCGWREDEDDRSGSKDHSIPYHRQNRKCDENPEIMKAILHAFFKVDHDAAQYEHFKLENDRVDGVALRQPSNPGTIGFLKSGLNTLLAIVFYIAAGTLQLAAQEVKSSHSLVAGDPMPDITIQNLLNYQATSAKISDFKGKLIILNFWSTTCHASTDLLQDLVKLQKAFPENLQIIAVGKQDLATVKDVSSRKGLSGLAFMPTNDRLLELFPHVLVPQLVWISPESKVLGITTEYDATEATIARILKGEKVAFKDPKADQIGFDSDKPLFLNGNGVTSSYLHRSILTPYCIGLPEGGGIRKGSSEVRIQALNLGRLQLYFLALGLPQYTWPASRIIYEGVDVSKFTSANWVEEKYQKAYCYELTLPFMFEDQVNAIMLHDLQKLFGSTAGLEKRMVPSYVLKVTNSKLLSASKGTKRGNNFQSKGPEDKWMSNTKLVELVEQLQEIPGNPPIIDETGYIQALDLKLGPNLGDIPALNKSLAKYGLQLQPEKRTLDMLIVSPIDVPEPITRKN